VIEMNWNMAEYLPEWCGAQTSFNNVVASYISNVFDKLQEESSRHAPGATPIKRKPSQSQSQASKAAGPDGGSSNLQGYLEFAQDLIAGELAQKLYFITQKISKKGTNHNESDRNELEIISSDDLDAPALAFVKSVCKVLSLDTNVTDQVNKLRRDLLKLLNIGEFSPKAIWKDPCVSFVLPEVICRACNHCRNLDLCKDPHKSTVNGVCAWLCPVCNTSYASNEIEHLLLALVHNSSMGYVLQDLVCDRCNNVKQPNMSQYCTCGGRFQTLVKRPDFSQKLCIFRNIAKLFGMPLLQEATEWIIKSNPWIKA